jgi:hypothetical protein
MAGAVAGAVLTVLALFLVAILIKVLDRIRQPGVPKIRWKEIRWKDAPGALGRSLLFIAALISLPDGLRLVVWFLGAYLIGLCAGSLAGYPPVPGVGLETNPSTRVSLALWAASLPFFLAQWLSDKKRRYQVTLRDQSTNWRWDYHTDSLDDAKQYIGKKQQSDKIRYVVKDQRTGNVLMKGPD